RASAEPPSPLAAGRRADLPLKGGGDPRGRTVTQTRIERRFAELKREGRAGLVTFITAGDPDYETSPAILKALPGAGADGSERGVRLSVPVADGRGGRAAAEGAVKAGQTMNE